MRRRSFSLALAILIPFWIIAEIIFGFTRDPLADTYTGDVYLVTNKNGHQVNTLLAAKLRLDVVDKGYVYDRRPGVFGTGVRIEFSGADVGVLARLGVSRKMINENGRAIPFSEPFCMTSKVSHERHAKFFGGSQSDYRGGFDYAAAFHLSFAKLSDDINCGQVHLGILNFNNLQFAMDNINPNGYIFADLKRESHISFIQKLIMSIRFDRNTVMTSFGG